jgi:hypothetical protein
MASGLTRRVAARALLAGGAAVVAIMLARQCESGGRQITVVVDPGALGESVRALRVDLLDDAGALGSIERVYGAGEKRTPVRLRAAAPGPGGELYIEVDTEGGLRRLHRPLAAEAGSTVTVRLGEDDAGGLTR